MRSLISLVLVIALACAVPARAQDASQAAESDANAANNPLTPEVTINLVDYFVPSAIGVPGESNQFLLRGLIPVGKFGGIGQLARFTVPIATSPPCRQAARRPLAT